MKGLFLEQVKKKKTHKEVPDSFFFSWRWAANFDLATLNVPYLNLRYLPSSLRRSGKTKTKNKTDSPQHPDWTQARASDKIWNSSLQIHYRHLWLTPASSGSCCFIYNIYKSDASTLPHRSGMNWLKCIRKESWREATLKFAVESGIRFLEEFLADLLVSAHYMGNYAKGRGEEERDGKQSKHGDREHLSHVAPLSHLAGLNAAALGFEGWLTTHRKPWRLSSLFGLSTKLDSWTGYVQESWVFLQRYYNVGCSGCVRNKICIQTVLHNKGYSHGTDQREKNQSKDRIYATL